MRGNEKVEEGKRREVNYISLGAGKKSKGKGNGRMAEKQEQKKANKFRDHFGSLEMKIFKLVFLQRCMTSIDGVIYIHEFSVSAIREPGVDLTYQDESLRGSKQ